jgi:hypothetical protein
VTNPLIPEHVKITDSSVEIDGTPFPYAIQEPADGGYELVEHVQYIDADDGGRATAEVKVLNLRVLLVTDETTLIDARASETDRRRQMARHWHQGWSAADQPPAKRYLVTSDMDLGMAWRQGVDAREAGADPLENPYHLAGEDPADGESR